MAFTTQEPYSLFRDEVVGPVYDKMRAMIPRLKHVAVTFIGGTTMFDDVPGPIYSESCRHILPA